MLGSTAALGGNQLFSSSFNFQEKCEALFGFSIHRNFTHHSFSSSLTLKPLICRASIQVQKASQKGKDMVAVHGLSETIVGVLGGGQLGRMLCQAASQMAIKVIVLDPMENCPASALSHYHMVGSYDDSAAVEEFSRRCGVLTVEIEHVDATTLEKLEQQGVDCQPKASTIRIIQDKYLQKVHFSRHAIPLPEFRQINDFESAKRAGDLFGYPLMVKSRRLAYDGRGNAVAKSEQELTSAVNGLGGYDHGLYVEKWAPFIKELAVIVARGRDNSILCYPVVETIHRENICQVVKAPANVPWKIMKLATDVAHRAVNSLEGAGVFAVELFLTADGQILLNEVAPRPHNSGHHSIESCFTSQYEQHLRAVVGLPLGDPSMKTFSLDIFDPFHDFPLSTTGQTSSREPTAIANTRIDWKETPEAHIFKVDLPGLKKEEVKVEIEDGRVLQFSGERTREQEEKNDKWHRVERSTGQFLRRFRLPENAKMDQVKATMENGVLTVCVPKEKEKKSEVKAINIS